MPLPTDEIEIGFQNRRNVEVVHRTTEDYDIHRLQLGDELIRLLEYLSDPYPGGRVNPNERPLFRTNFNPKYKKYIILATDPNTINRPSLNEWKFIIQKSDNYKCTIL
jgi:hypothetical protein